jgi:hypothetical protein
MVISTIEYRVCGNEEGFLGCRDSNPSSDFSSLHDNEPKTFMIFCATGKRGHRFGLSDKICGESAIGAVAFLITIVVCVARRQ